MSAEKSTLCCPECRREMLFEELVNNNVQAELYATINRQPALLQGALQSYIGLFKGKNKVPFLKALGIVMAVLEMESDKMRLANALLATINGLRADPSGLPLTCHNYLKKVLKSTPATVTSLAKVEDAMIPQRQVPQQTSKTSLALSELEDLRGEYE